MTQSIRRGDIFSVDLAPVHGSEKGATRLALVVQNDVGNRYSPTVIVAAISIGSHTRFDVNVVVRAPEGGLVDDSFVLLNQLHTVDQSRLDRHLGRVSRATMLQVDEAIKISLGLVPI